MPLPAMATTLSVRENAILGRARILQMVFVIIIIIVTAVSRQRPLAFSSPTWPCTPQARIKNALLHD